VTDHARREPWEVEFLLALDDLPERGGQVGRVAALGQIIEGKQELDFPWFPAGVCDIWCSWRSDWTR